MKQKTIGPLGLRRGDWTSSLSSVTWLCDAILRARFNIPDTARKLWVTLTRECPKHGDAIRVRREKDYAHERWVRLDDDAAHTRFSVGAYQEADDFGSDFYATIYYE